MGAHNRQPIGQCIYCRRVLPPEELGDEHIIPKGIGGLQDASGNMLTLLKASCQECAAVVNVFETAAMEGFLKSFRVSTNTRSNRKRGKGGKKGPLTQTFRLGPEGAEVAIEFSGSDHVGVVALPMWEPPRILTGAVPEEPGNLRINIAILRVLPDYYYRKAKIDGPWKFDVPFKPSHWAQFMAKIAYCYTIAKIGLDAFEPFVLGQILVTPEDDASLYVGCESQNLATTRHFHSCSYHEISRNGERWILVRVRLLSKWGGHPFLVVVGKRKLPDPSSP